MRSPYVPFAPTVLRRRTAQFLSAGLATTCVAFVYASAALGAPGITVPASARSGAPVTVRASGLASGRYSLILGFTALAPHGLPPTVCFAKVGSSASAAVGKVTISGKLPTRLGCHQAAGPIEGHISVKPGKYFLAVGALVANGVFDYGKSYVKHTIQITS
jgi:hypothetical protein